ncbi:hypothetical protein NDU88_006903 [Pleurodeles waltl]|uniref:Uncharacterized protein n=1 Tax=Pleurodeles waltl TaxID=8319 RepID=A0AAV7N8P0_PLEWA|nr:hypothetical protein NDU88_006903 [Pleurodeles waltl]
MAAGGQDRHPGPCCGPWEEAAPDSFFRAAWQPGQSSGEPHTMPLASPPVSETSGGPVRGSPTSEAETEP